MKRIVIVGNSAKEGVLRAVEAMEPWLRELADVRVDLDMAADVAPGEFDMAVVVGGDGSMLRAARKLCVAGVPLLGVNVGKFGFLTETTADEFQGVLKDVLASRCEVAERMMLRCALTRDGREMLATVALNDAVVSRSALSRLMTLEIDVDGERVTTYRADGIIISTPVGSTAHSLAAGGPIIHPELDALVISPICPHTLSNRPLVLPAGSVVAIRVGAGADGPALTVDGQVFHELCKGDLVEVRRADTPLRLIKTGERTFFETLRNKLDWSGQPRYVGKDV